MNDEAIPCDARAARGAGRPRDPAKLEAMLDAARAEFFRLGFGAATIEAIADSAGVSKVTVYNRFGGKAGLFEAVMRRESERMAEIMAGGHDAVADLTGALNAYGVALLAFLLDSNRAALDAILTQELAQLPDLAQRFFAAGPGNCRARLAEVLAAADARGAIAIDDPVCAAEDLMALWKGMIDVELKFGLQPECGDAQLAARVMRGTRLFLKAYAAG